MNIDESSEKIDSITIEFASFNLRNLLQVPKPSNFACALSSEKAIIKDYYFGMSFSMSVIC